MLQVSELEDRVEEITDSEQEKKWERESNDIFKSSLGQH